VRKIDDASRMSRHGNQKKGKKRMESGEGGVKPRAVRDVQNRSQTRDQQGGRVEDETTDVGGRLHSKNGRRGNLDEERRNV